MQRVLNIAAIHGNVYTALDYVVPSHAGQVARKIGAIIDGDVHLALNDGTGCSERAGVLAGMDGRLIGRAFHADHHIHIATDGSIVQCFAVISIARVFCLYL